MFARRPTLARVMERYGDLTLGAYANTFSNVGRGTAHATIQPPDDFIEIAARLTEKILGADVADKLKKRLHASPVILTANHHGPEFFHITLQGDILFSLQEALESVVPIFAFGDIPLNNWTAWPRGILISDTAKLALFPDSMKHALVSVTPRFTREMVEAALAQLDQPLLVDTATEGQRRVVRSILEEDYLDPAVLALDDYSEQTTYINAKLWRRLFADELRKQVPDMAYLEMEKVAVQLLEKDIVDDDSLLHTLMFDASMRDALVKLLNGKPSCWHVEILEKRADPATQPDERRSLRGAGTMFFWGVDAKKRHFPLVVKKEEQSLYLLGVDDSGNQYRFDMTPDALVGYLRAKTLLPSLFTTFTSVAFARGFICYGGIMQTDYLTNMREAVTHTLAAHGRSAWAEQVDGVKTDNYATGTYGIVRIGSGGKIMPAGMIDIIEKKGIDAARMAYLRDRITMHQASVLGLCDMYKLAYRADEQDPELAAISMEEIYRAGSPMVELDFQDHHN